MHLFIQAQLLLTGFQGISQGVGEKCVAPLGPRASTPLLKYRQLRPTGPPYQSGELPHFWVLKRPCFPLQRAWAGEGVALLARAGFLILTFKADRLGACWCLWGAGHKELGESVQGAQPLSAHQALPSSRLPTACSKSQAAANYKRTLNSVRSPLD